MPKDKKSDLQKQIDNRELSSHIQIQIEQESRNLFKNETTRRKAMSAGGRKIAILAVTLLVIFVVSVLLIPIDGKSLPVWRSQIIANFRNIFSFDVGHAGERWAAFAAMILAGMAMTTAGATYQGIFQNPMASPTILGVQSGGMLGGIVYIMLFLPSATLNFYSEHVNRGIFVARGSEIISYRESLTQIEAFGLQIWEIVGCFFGVALIVGISMLAGHGKINTVALMLAGSIFATVINQLAQTVQYVILYNKPEDYEDIRYYLISEMLGSSSGAGGGNVMPIDNFLWLSIPVVICLIIIFSLANKLNVMMYGAEEARAMGVPVQFYRIIFIILCTLLCAVVFSFYGAINMIGFIVPHFARFMVGPDFKKLVPASAMLGGITTLLVWDFCSIINRPGSFNLYSGVVCTAMSLIFILFYRRQRHANWT